MRTLKIRRHAIVWLGTIILALFMTTAPACAQSTTGSIYGTAADSSGTLIPGAAVTAVQLETNETHAIVSNASGN
jgi:hypothetical protein